MNVLWKCERIFPPQGSTSPEVAERACDIGRNRALWWESSHRKARFLPIQGYITAPERSEQHVVFIRFPPSSQNTVSDIYIVQSLPPRLFDVLVHPYVTQISHGYHPDITHNPQAMYGEFYQYVKFVRTINLSVSPRLRETEILSLTITYMFEQPLSSHAFIHTLSKLSYFFTLYILTYGIFLIGSYPIATHFVPLDMKGCICHSIKWQIHPFISKGRICAYESWMWGDVFGSKTIKLSISSFLPLAFLPLYFCPL